jgi:hypothetical protein
LTKPGLVFRLQEYSSNQIEATNNHHGDAAVPPLPAPCKR